MPFFICSFLDSRICTRCCLHCLCSIGNISWSCNPYTLSKGNNNWVYWTVHVNFSNHSQFIGHLCTTNSSAKVLPSLFDRCCEFSSFPFFLYHGSDILSIQKGLWNQVPQPIRSQSQEKKQIKREASIVVPN